MFKIINDSETLKNIERLLSAILMLLVEERERALKRTDSENRNIEVLLAEAGFNGPEVARIINKNLAAVQKAIQRSRKQK